MPHDGLESVARVEPHHAEESIDALAELFLGEALKHDERATPVVGRIGGDAPAPETAAPVEAIVLGQLPVLASAWAVQYARMQSERLGRPVCLARLTEQTATVEIVGDARAGGPARDLPDALARASARAQAWVVLTELDPGDVAKLPGVRAVTVLTGADDAAVVGVLHRAQVDRRGGRGRARGACRDHGLERSGRARRAGAHRAGRPPVPGHPPARGRRAEDRSRARDHALPRALRGKRRRTLRACGGDRRPGRARRNA